MRLWHKDLINVLPRPQLVAQWREHSSIAGNIKMKGTPNHILVNKVMDYDFSHFISYAHYVRAEMTRRGYSTMDSVWQKIESLKLDWELISLDELFPNWHNERYLFQCVANLQEKYDCGGVDVVDWEKIETKKYGMIFKRFETKE